nr:MAG TPA: hypothetical protein [Caudoviricetes sp.]
MNENGISLADIAAVTDSNGALGGGSSALIILFLIFAMMCGGFGFGANRNMPPQAAQPVTEAGLCSAMNFNDLSNAVGRLSDMSQTQFMQTSQGLATVGYENLRNFAATQQLVQNGDYALSSQLADCCCKTQTAIKDVEYQGAMNTAAINANVTAQSQKIIDAITGNRMADMQAQIDQLRLSSALCGVVRYPMSSAYSAGIGPFFNAQCCGNGYNL